MDKDAAFQNLRRLTAQKRLEMTLAAACFGVRRTPAVFPILARSLRRRYLAWSLPHSSPPSAPAISSSSSHRRRGSSLPTDAASWSEQLLASVASSRETDRS
ncbi:hypothetical protein AAHA92_29250 [Salvia divinorum]|uniref:Uncharacterized protein n=1 Tax=Salvia divinorum TaxID=28513 RepID=A0ABD1FY80_SALDI